MYDARRKRRGQAMVELAVTLPVLIVLVAGTIELGRGYMYATAVSDAARDGARFLAGKTAATNGPGLAALCKLEIADLAAVTPTVSCPTTVAVKPPYSAPGNFTTPAAGAAVVVVYCGSSAPACLGSPTLPYRSEVDVYVAYRFSDLNLLGGGITIGGLSTATTSW